MHVLDSEPLAALLKGLVQLEIVPEVTPHIFSMDSPLGLQPLTQNVRGFKNVCRKPRP